MQSTAAASLASKVWARARTLPPRAALEWYLEQEKETGFDTQLRRELARRDLYYLMRVLIGRLDMGHPWVYARIREVEVARDGYLDLWAREHRKSTIITFGCTIQDILASHGDNPLPQWGGVEVTFGIFSHTRPIAKKFLRQIKTELEDNEQLKALYPDILWEDPQHQAARWSEDAGLIVKRRTNPKEATVEAWGLIDGQPTAAHFYRLVYDDVISREEVNTPDMIERTTEAYELSVNLGVADGGRERFIGTRYAFMDTYSVIQARGVATPRIYPSTEDGTEAGKPVLFSREEHEKRRRAMGPVTFAAQMLQRPITKATATFDVEHLKFIAVRPKTLNVYILGDPAHSKRRGSDKTAFAVIGVDAQRNKYLVDGYNHRMNLRERWDALKGLRKKWMRATGVQSVIVAYERYGLQSDLEHFATEMERDQEAFEIVEVAWPREGPGAKGDRIMRLRPDFENGHFFLPLIVTADGILHYLKLDKGEVTRVKATASTALMQRVDRAGERYRILTQIARKDEEGRTYDLTLNFILEYLAHPAPGAFDDLIDAASRIYDLDVVAPIVINEKDLLPEVFVDS